MKVKYEATMKFTIEFDIDTMEDLKDNNEMTHDIGAMVCDEATVCGGVASYEILESKIDVREKVDEEIDDKIYN